MWHGKGRSVCDSPCSRPPPFFVSFSEFFNTVYESESKPSIKPEKEERRKIERLWICWILLQVLSTEREKHAATETELNMKNLGLADKLKEARGELTGTSSDMTSFRFIFRIKYCSIINQCYTQYHENEQLFCNNFRVRVANFAVNQFEQFCLNQNLLSVGVSFFFLFRLVTFLRRLIG